jgi:hypothetical protein
MVCGFRGVAVTMIVPCVVMLCSACGSGDTGGSGSPLAFASPGGFVEKAGSEIRPRWSTAEVHDVVPQTRGKFTFPAPYGTDAIRVTAPEDCGGADCVSPVGYSYWRNMNNHVGSNEILIFLGLDRTRGGTGPTLFSYDKSSELVTNRGPLFAQDQQLSWANAAGWYFSATRPTTIYINDGSKMLRYDALSHASEVVFDVAQKFGSDAEVWQMSSSYYDDVHAATLRLKGTDNFLGCLVYTESTGQLSYYPRLGADFDECEIDKSGRFLMIWEQIDGNNGMDNRIIDLTTGAEERHLDGPGVASLGHHDMGFAYAVGHDHLNPLPNATVTWNLAPVPALGPVSNRDYNWELVQAQHISHTNAQPNLPKEQQFACGSNADRTTYAQNEIVCFKLDGSLAQLVVAPVMTDLDASGGGASDYDKAPKGNLDVTGQYFIWTTNLGGNRLDAFIVKVPAQLL